jgi:hypothetical protein
LHWTSMKLVKLLTVPLFLLLFLTGCTGKHLDRDQMRDQVNVFGVQLFSEVDYKDINGVEAVEEPCIRGYERSFDALDITLGYGINKRIRKITTRNPGTSLFGINPGLTFQKGKQKILQTGLVELTPPFIFQANGYTLKFLVDDNDIIFGLTLESLE